MIPKVISARHRGDMGDRLRVATVGRCGVHAEGAGAPPRGRKVHMRTESAAASLAAGTLHLHRYNARSPGRPCPQAPQGQGPPACSPGHTAGVPRRLARHVVSGRSTSARGEGPGLIRLRRARLTRPRLGQTTGKGRGHREGQGTQGGAGQADENSGSEGGAGRSRAQPWGAPEPARLRPAHARGGGPWLTGLGRPHGRRLRPRPRSPARPLPSPAGRARTGRPHLTRSRGKPKGVFFFALFCYVSENRSTWRSFKDLTCLSQPPTGSRGEVRRVLAETASGSPRPPVCVAGLAAGV